jgi:NAD(P)-dependent dehydrogenase (short-subunit alcohol dehydrogenase family)
MMLKEKIAVITGAAGGIGRAIAERYVREGATVAVTDINIESIARTAQEIGPSAVPFQVDVTDRALVDAMVWAVEDKLGPVDIFVNNAGISEIVPFLELDDAAWARHIDVNLKGAFLCSQAILKRMVPRNRGKLINISSQSGKKGNSQYEAYCASKFGIIGLTQSMAVEFAENKININAICPGVVFTPLWEKMMPAYAAKRNIPVEKVREYIVGRIPLGRACTPQDVAGVAAFLASADSDYMTGQALNVTGGTIMH